VRLACNSAGFLPNWRQPALTAPALVIRFNKCKRRPVTQLSRDGDGTVGGGGGDRARGFQIASPGPRTMPPHRAGPRNQRRGPFSLAITSCDTAVRYAFSDDRAGLLLLYNISQSLIFRNRTGACIIMPLGVLLSFSWAAIHHPLSAAYQHRPA
jgi:hypothetical protein